MTWRWFRLLVLCFVFIAPHGAAVGQSGSARRVVLDAPDELGAEERSKFVAFVERTLERVEKSVRHRMQRAVIVRYRRSVDDLKEHDRHPFHRWTVAYARPERSELVLVEERVKPDPPDDLVSVLAHELTHVVLGDLERLLSKHRRRIPRWFHEGLAQVVAGSRYLSGDDQLIWFRARTNRLLSMSSLAKSFPADEEMLRIAYAQSASYFKFLDRKVGRRTVMQALRDWLRGGPKNLDVALSKLHEDEWSFVWAEGEWARELQQVGALSFFRDTCFNLLMLLALPLLGIVLYKRFRRERLAGERIERWEQREDELRRSWIELRRRRAPDPFEIEFDDSGPFDDDSMPHDEPR